MKFRQLKLIFTALFIVLSIFFPFSAASAGSINVGYSDDKNYITCDAAGRYRGFGYEYLKTLGNYMGTDLNFSADSLEKNIARLLDYDVDVVACPEQSLSIGVPPVLPNLPSTARVVPMGMGMGAAIVRSTDFLLYDNLNRALQEVETVNPLYRFELYKKYQQETPLDLTADEIAYLKEKSALYVMASTQQAPYTYFDGNDHQGIVADILKEMSTDLGIKIVAIPSRNQTNMMESLERGKIDLVADFNADHNWADSKNAVISFPYLSLNYIKVVRRDKPVPDMPIVACARDHYYTAAFVESMFDSTQLSYYDSIAECMEAVNNGEADMTFVKAITAQSDIYQGQYYNLYTDGEVVFSHDVAIAISKNADPILLHIINKEIAHISAAKIESIINRNTFRTNSADTIAGIVYRNPAEVTGFVAAGSLLALIILSSYLFIRQRHNRELYRRAYTDPFTGLYNLYWLVKKLPLEIKQYEDFRREGKLFVLAITAQRFLFIKENYDHRLLYSSILKMIKSVRKNNPWLLSDAFSVDANTIYVHCRCPENVEPVDAVRKLLQSSSVVTVAGIPTAFSYVCGICMVPSEGEIDAQKILDNAHAAQAEALRLGKSVVVFDDTLYDNKLLQQKLEDNMYKALVNNEFKVYYQPKYDIANQTICAAEALVRWDSPEFGFLMPGKFIELFERNGFAIQLDYYMLDHVCRYQQQRLARGEKVVPISVNQSGLHITEENYLEHMQSIADKYNLPAGTIELELTETAFIDYTTKGERKNSANIISSLKKMGFALSMDDFCTGYSSIAMLENLPMDVMKIDRTMLLAAEKSPRSRTILEHVVKLGKDLGMQVLTEGIETPEQEKLLLSIGCNLGQGFLFAKPMPEDDFNKFIETH